MIMSDSQITDYKLKRGLHICKKMSRDHQFKNEYMKFMKELMSRGYATESTAES